MFAAGDGVVCMCAMERWLTTVRIDFVVAIAAILLLLLAVVLHVWLAFRDGGWSPTSQARSRRKGPKKREEQSVNHAEVALKEPRAKRKKLCNIEKQKVEAQPPVPNPRVVEVKLDLPCRG